MQHEEIIINCIHEWQNQHDDSIPLDFPSYIDKHARSLFRERKDPIHIPFLPSNVKTLICDNSILPELPTSLIKLYTSNSKLSQTISTSRIFNSVTL